MFKTFGFDEVYVLDGGLNEWERIGGTLDTEAIKLEQVEAKFKALDNRHKLIPFEDVVELVNKKKTHTMIDARSKARFSGNSVEPRKGVSSGNIPGSKNVPYVNLLTDKQCFRPKHEIKREFEEAGVSMDEDKYYFTCGSGVTACINMLALIECGVDFEKCILYDGSFSEWGVRYKD